MSDATLFVDLVGNFKNLKRQAKREKVEVGADRKGMAGRDRASGSASSPSGGKGKSPLSGLGKIMRTLIGVIAAATAGLGLLIPLFSGFMGAFQPLFDALEGIGQILGGFLVPIIQLLMPLLGLLARFLGVVLRNYMNFFADPAGAFSAAFEMLGDIIRDVFNGFLGDLKQVFSNLFPSLGSAGQSETGFLGGFGSAASGFLGRNIPGFGLFSDVVAGFSGGGRSTGSGGDNVNINVEGLLTEGTMVTLQQKVQEVLRRQ